MMFCLNLCEIFTGSWFPKKYFERLLQYFSEKEQKVERIYIGSSFCSQYYLRFEGWNQLLHICKSNQIPVTLVLPVFSEKNLISGKKKTLEIIQNVPGIIDEITVNDVGMLQWLKRKEVTRINLGRLFFKEPRDCRMPEYFQKSLVPSLLTLLYDDYWSDFKISGVELDATNQVIDINCIKNNDIDVGIHLPYCYMTTGNICKFASVHKRIEQKFRPNLECMMECMYMKDIYSKHVHQTNCDPVLYRLGRTVYFKVSSVDFEGKKPKRILYFPVDEWKNIREEYDNENIGPIK